MASVATSVAIRPPVRWRQTLHTASFAVAPVLIVLLVAIYAVSPEFYLSHIHENLRREFMVVELITVGSAALGGMLLLAVAGRRWRERQRAAAALVAVVGAAALFFAGEEISWGQSFFGWRTPEAYASFSHETNLHNSELGIQSLGSVFLIVMFFVLPALGRWGLGRGRRLPEGWKPALAGSPVVCCMAVGFAWKEVKNLYRLIPGHEGHALYQEFVMQINEHKEMLVAVALLMFGVMQAAAVFSKKAAHPRAGR